MLKFLKEVFIHTFMNTALSIAPVVVNAQHEPHEP